MYKRQPSWLPKSSHAEEINSDVVKKCFTEIQKNPDFESRSEVINCLTLLEPHCDAIANLLDDIIKTQGSERSYENLNDWIIDNVHEDLRSMTCLLINEVLQGGHALRDLESEIRHLATIPIIEWSTEIPDQGVPVYYKDGTDECRMRVSKDYLQRATFAYLYENILNTEKFEENLTEIENLYCYDQEILDCIQDAKDLQKPISDRIKENTTLPRDKMVLSITQLVNKTQLSENSKRTIPLIINEILLQRGALRTFNQEIERWRKEPIETWPTQVKEQGVRYLNKEDVLRFLPTEKLTQWVNAYNSSRWTLDMADRIYNSTKPVLLTAAVGFIATKILNSMT